MTPGVTTAASIQVEMYSRLTTAKDHLPGSVRFANVGPRLIQSGDPGPHFISFHFLLFGDALLWVSMQILLYELPVRRKPE